MKTLSQLLFVLAVSAFAGCGGGAPTPAPKGGSAAGTPITAELLNVSYDPTRELWKELNAAFTTSFEKAGNKVTTKQSHGASGSQARAVIDGLEADVVSLALWPDTDQLRKKDLIKAGWEEKFPNRSLPYTSTIVFVVRKGNPKGVKEWADLVKPGIEIITPSPKTSGNGKLAFLAAWGSVTLNGGDEEKAKAFVTQLYDQLSGDSGDDDLLGDDGNDSIIGGSGNDDLHGGLGDDNLSGDDGNDTASGDDGNDSVKGGNGNDDLDGDDGNDQVDGGSGDDDLSGGSDDDTLDGGSGDDVLKGDDGNDDLDGDDGDDSLHGGAGDDDLDGGEGADDLLGDDGDDLLDDDEDDDVVDGGAGDDSDDDDDDLIDDTDDDEEEDDLFDDLSLID